MNEKTLKELVERSIIDEEKLLSEADDVDRVYLEEVLPQKMSWNLRSIRELSMISEIRTMLRTVIAVFR